VPSNELDEVQVAEATSRILADANGYIKLRAPGFLDFKGPVIEGLVTAIVREMLHHHAASYAALDLLKDLGAEVHRLKGTVARLEESAVSCEEVVGVDEAVCATYSEAG
jgi:hypothetical protein